jgi:hypothetical protein
MPDRHCHPSVRRESLSYLRQLLCGPGDLLLVVTENLKVIGQAKPDPLDGKIPDEVHNGTFQAVEGMTV